MLAGEFSITRNFHPQVFLLAGLAEGTKFNLGEVVELLWQDRYFGVPPRPKHGQTPKLGTLHASIYRWFVTCRRLPDQKSGNVSEQRRGKRRLLRGFKAMGGYARRNGALG